MHVGSSGGRSDASASCVQLLIAPPDTVKRYDALMLPASLQAAWHRGVAFAGPTTVVVAAERTGPLQWPATDNVTFARTPGDHNSMLQPPHVVALAEAITVVLSKGRATNTTTSAVGASD